MNKSIHLVIIKYILLSLLGIYSVEITAQTPTQTIRGVILDTDNNHPITVAEITLLGTDPLLGTTSDQNGKFRIEAVPVGRYQLEVRYLGYQTLIISELLLESGKENVLEITLEESISKLSEIVVRGEKNPRNNNTQLTSIHTITVEETLRYPATFYDPARLAIAFAGVVNDNDQANNLSIRGNSPNSMSWRLEGVEIVNPNHLSNAGTFNDRVTQNGGGVNILSAQMLGTSSLMTGAWSTEYGNALSGIMDMSLRDGNNEQHQFTGQIGLIGIDLSAEGPISKNKESSYLVNYRYSTLGILNAMGVELGDEAIGFQDLAFKLSFPHQKGGQFSFFGMGGISDNVFEADRDSTLWEFSKDRFDISFENKMGAIGASYHQTIGDNSILKSVVILSALENTRTADSLNNQLKLSQIDRDNFTKRKLSFATTIQHKINTQNRIITGLTINHLYDNMQSSINGGELLSNGTGSGILLQPHFRWQFFATKNTLINLGLHYLYYDFNKTHSLEPRASVRWSLPQKQQVSLAYGLHSQLQLPQVYFASFGGRTNPNRNLDFTKAHHFVLSYQKKLKSTAKLKAELYYQRLFNVPISSGAIGTFSTLNLLDGFVDDVLENKGTGDNYGLELSWQKYLTDDFYYLINTSLYNSKYSVNGKTLSTRFNGNYIFNAMAGKEWSKQKSNKKIIFGINTRITYLGGFRDSPINLEQSIAQNKTIYNLSNPFSIKQKTYFKTDLRIYWKRNKQKYNNTLALDVQNVSNQKNEAFNYFDTQQQKIITKYQLGLIPILSYRIEF